MPLQHAINFIYEVRSNCKLCEKLVRLGPHEIKKYLHRLGFRFTHDELDETIKTLEQKCKCEFDSYELNEISHWYNAACEY